MNERIVDTIRLVYYYMNHHPLRFIYGKDKVDLFLLLQNRFLCSIGSVESFDIEFKLDMKSDGSLYIESLLDKCYYNKASYKNFNYGDRDEFITITLQERNFLKLLVDKYGMIDYDTFMEMILDPVTNLFPESVELDHIPITFKLEDLIRKEYD